MGFLPNRRLPVDNPFRRVPAPTCGKPWIALELVPGALAGVVGKVEYPPPFGER